MSTVGERSAWWGESDDDLRYVPPPGTTQQVSERGAWLRQSSAVVQATAVSAPPEHSTHTVARSLVTGATEWLANRLAEHTAVAEAEDEEHADDWEDEQDGEDWETEEEVRPTWRRRRARSDMVTDTALVPRSWISFVMVWLVRTGLLAMLLGSFLGSVATFNPEGIAPILAAFPWLRPFAEPALVTGAHQNALLLGVGAQLWITGIEYWKAPKQLTLRALFRRENWCYSAHLAVDIGLTIWGWRPIVIPWLITLIGKALVAVQLPGAAPWMLLGAAYALTVVLALLFALLPERGLVRG